MKIPTDIAFENSYVLDLKIEPYAISLVTEFALHADHPLFSTDFNGKAFCYRTGVLTISRWKEMSWAEPSGSPGIEPDLTTSYSFDAFEADGSDWRLEGDWGIITGKGGNLEIVFDENLTATQNPISVNYFDHFKGGPKIVFHGNQKSLTHFSQVLSAVALGNAVQLSNQPQSRFLVVGTDIHFSLSTSDKEKISRHKVGKNIFDIQLSRQTIADILSKISALADSPQAGHQYVDITHSEIQLMISKDEYTKDLKP